MKLYTCEWTDNGKAARKTFHQRKLAIEFGQERVRTSGSCGSVSIFVYEYAGPVLHAIMIAHDRGEWWDKRKYMGTVLKTGTFTTR